MKEFKRRNKIENKGGGARPQAAREGRWSPAICDFHEKCDKYAPNIFTKLRGFLPAERQKDEQAEKLA